MNASNNTAHLTAPPLPTYARFTRFQRWLAANNSGGTMTYPHMHHIHADVGPYHFVSLAGQRTRHAAHRRGTRTSGQNANSL